MAHVLEYSNNGEDEAKSRGITSTASRQLRCKEQEDREAQDDFLVSLLDSDTQRPRMGMFGRRSD